MASSASRPPTPEADAPRIGLVLGAGGITGIAWLMGALAALRERTGWDAATADLISGTSAGAAAAAVVASRTDATELLRYAEDREALEAATHEALHGRESVGPDHPWPGSLALGLTGLLAASPRKRVTSLVGFLPTGRRPTDEIRGLTHAAVSGGWPTGTRLWIHACDYKTGRRVTFGRPGAPEADLADAVAASCAVPVYYRPVRIGGRRYVDGGLWSFTNADALAGEHCDIVLCLSPFASRARSSLLATAVYGPLRAATTWNLDREVRLLRDRGTRVAIVEPAAADLAAMGLNPMDRGRSRRVLETARESVASRLDDALDGIELPRSPRRSRRARVA